MGDDGSCGLLGGPLEMSRAGGRLRLVAFTSGGEHQKHLVQLLAQKHDVCGLVVHVPPAPRRRAWIRDVWGRLGNAYALAEHLHARAVLHRQEEGARDLHRRLFDVGGRPPCFPPDIPTRIVSDVNCPVSLELLAHAKPDTIVVNGTNLLRAPILEVGRELRLGIINVHTGLSPYCRGGNCNLHAVLHRQLQLVGATVHYIDAGIDSGDIMASGRPEIDEDDTMGSLDEKVFSLGETLLLEALSHVQAGRAKRIPQWTPGWLFLKRNGYNYRPALRVRANHILREEGLISQYRIHRKAYDENVTVVHGDSLGAIRRPSVPA